MEGADIFISCSMGAGWQACAGESGKSLKNLRDAYFKIILKQKSQVHYKQIHLYFKVKN